MQGRNARGLDPRKSQCPHRRGVLQTPPFRDRVQTPCSRQHRVKHSVGVGEMHVSKEIDDTLIAFGLGSCLGVIVYDPVAHVGGILHSMLPLASFDPEKAIRNAAMFVDTGVPSLFRSCYEQGALKYRMTVKIVRGATISIAEENDLFQIGRKNIIVLKRILEQSGISIQASDVAGRVSRTVTLTVSNGDVHVRSNDTLKFL